MNNIFENAYFGKPYKTRDGRKAIYHLKEKEHNEHILIIDNWYAFIRYKSNGKHLGGNSNIDIVSEWQEPINEDELDKMAKDYSLPLLKENHNKTYGFMLYDIRDGFKSGYRQAKEL